MSKPDFNEQEFQEICQTALKFKHTATQWERIGGLLRKLDQVDFATVNIETLSNFCGLSNIIIMNNGYNYKIYDKIRVRIEELLKEPAKITDDHLLNFLDCLNTMERFDLADSINKILAERIPIMRYKSYVKYL